MTKSEQPELQTLFSLLWGHLMMQKRFHHAAMTSFLAHVVGRETGDPELERGALSQVYKAIDELRETSRASSTSSKPPEALCSFCGRGEPEVRLVAGANAFICDSCAKTVAEVFEGHPPVS